MQKKKKGKHSKGIIITSKQGGKIKPLNVYIIVTIILFYV